jgi:adenine-specific DNA-methyltransferase
MTTDPGDLVLDPTCGSATTAYVAEQWGRRWITIDTSRVALTLARTRLMAARFPYYLLADSPEGRRKECELQGVPAWEAAKPGRPHPGPLPEGEGDVRKGFVYKRVPHVTLKSIANNEEIDAIHARWQEQLEPLRAKINKALGKKWEEWEVPRPEALTPGPSPKGRGEKELLEQWWELRRARQKEIDGSIARRADVELLYDQPYEDPKRVRVTGPFTVESLSPHRTLSVERKKNLTIELEGTRHPRVIGPDDFGHMILEHLRVAGVQNTYKKERLKFDTLDPFPGEWIHGAGTYTESGAKTRRVAVCIGPEHGTVGPQLVKEAAKEAVQGVGFDVLVLCGFAFDPHVSEEAKRYGKLVVLPTRMNPDLSMGELLKKTGSGNLFMVFGEPDLKVTRQKDGRMVVEIQGLDVYDPTTGEIRSSSTDDVACWFIDTNYNEESFFVRHAYFTGADQPYEKLKRALRAEIDEAAWGALYSTVSRPFDPPETGKIAVKVINHYGDEVLKVYDAEQA